MMSGSVTLEVLTFPHGHKMTAGVPDIVPTLITAQFRKKLVQCFCGLEAECWRGKTKEGVVSLYSQPSAGIPRPGSWVQPSFLQGNSFPQWQHYFGGAASHP